MMECGDMGDMKGMMSKMMEGCPSEMMMEMMPECLGMMLSKLPQDKQTQMVKKLISILLEKAGAGMTEEDKKDLVYKIMGTGRV
jgi:hypothetical protein